MKETRVGYATLQAMRDIYDNIFKTLLQAGNKLNVDDPRFYNALDMKTKYDVPIEMVIEK